PPPPSPLASSPTTQGFGSERLSTAGGSPIGGMISSLRLSFLGVPGWVSQLKGMCMAVRPDASQLRSWNGSCCCMMNTTQFLWRGISEPMGEN
ncbi:hypothetical protein LINPERHAP2_LOCUS40298, partial [Linum perenne]